MCLMKICLFLVVSTVQCCKNEFHLSNCPVEDSQQWKDKNTECAKKDPSFVFHCQTAAGNRDVTGHCSLCAKSVECHSGTYPRLDMDDTVSCHPCDDDTYQSTTKQSNKFIVSGCENTFQKCTDVQYECRPGSSKAERLCACDWNKSYKPDVTQGTDCTCFSRDDGCTCLYDDCGEGMQMNRSYKCQPVPEQFTTIRKDASSPSHSTTESSLSKEDNNVAVKVIFSVVGVVVAVVVVVGIVKRKKIRSLCRRTVNEDETTVEPLNSPTETTVETLNPPTDLNIYVQGDLKVNTTELNNAGNIGNAAIGNNTTMTASLQSTSVVPKVD